MNLNYSISEKQAKFIEADAFETLYGGAAGGGKSHGQILDAFLYAMKWRKSTQLFLRRTFKELDKSIIRKAQEVFPQGKYTYNKTSRTITFFNGSIIDFGYLASDSDVYQYQSAEYDVIRFDEATHFTEFQYLYLISRCRGDNNHPKMIKSSTNPGGVGHTFFKARFIDPSPPFKKFDGYTNGKFSGTRLYIPATVHDNVFLMRSDPDYITRLENLPERQRKALLTGDWNLADGLRFTSFDEAVHVCDPFELPKSWRRYRTIDYGLDRLACEWVAMSPDGDIYVYKELAESNLIISEAARKIREMSEGEDIYCTLAPDDLWSRSQETGKCRADLFANYGVPLVKVTRDRPGGWAAVDETLKVRDGKSKLHIFRNCFELIKCLPQLQIDTKKPDDVMTEPHDITHAPDAFRNFAVYWYNPGKQEEQTEFKAEWSEDMYEDYRNASAAEKKELIKMWGRPQR